MNYAVILAGGRGVRFNSVNIPKQFVEIFCKNPQNLVEQRITPHFLIADHPNYYEFTTKG